MICRRQFIKRETIGNEIRRMGSQAIRNPSDRGTSTENILNPGTYAPGST
jgi:hypothetical protein